jgi:ABC-type antimicrobial peptide transport system permease subunit
VAYHASRRVHEIGLRMALGASARDVLALVTGQGLRPVLIGLALGAMGALAATQVLRSALYGVTPTDPITFVGAAAAMLLAAFAAAFLPAQRATRIDPGRVLTRG